MSGLSDHEPQRITCCQEGEHVGIGNFAPKYFRILHFEPPSQTDFLLR
jgi:hypothetical protein